MQAIEPPLEPDDRGAELTLRARRVVYYSPLFIWGMVVFWTAFVVLQLFVTGGDWLSALRFGAPGLFIGVVLGIRFRDAQ
jgi:hypothetical protein